MQFIEWNSTAAQSEEAEPVHRAHSATSAKLSRRSHRALLVAQPDISDHGPGGFPFSRRYVRLPPARERWPSSTPRQGKQLPESSRKIQGFGQRQAYQKKEPRKGQPLGLRLPSRTSVQLRAKLRPRIALLS